MAVLSAMSVNHPQWTKDGAHWVKSYPSSPSVQTTSERSSMETTSTPLATDILLNIIKVLRKLDSKMEVQGRRLEILETTGPTSNTGSTLVNYSPISRKQSARTAASKCTFIPSEDGEDTNEYARSILKMDYAIDEAVSFTCRCKRQWIRKIQHRKVPNRGLVALLRYVTSLPFSTITSCLDYYCSEPGV